MPPVVYAAATVVAAAVATIGWLFVSPRDGAREQVLANASHGFGVSGTRTARPAGSGYRLARRLTPRGAVVRLERSLGRAGRPPQWTADRLLAAKLLLPTAVAGLGVLFIESGPSTGRYLLAGIVVLVCYFVPDLLIQSRGQQRQTTIALELPDTLDQMTIAVEAGLGFEAAMMRAAKNGTGPLAEELTRTLQDMQLGQSRREAYLSLAGRTNTPDLGRFLRAVIQADLYGIGIADVLRTQAGEMRLKRRQRAEEKAMKIPVKVIFPLMLCILPALFIVLLGPVVIQVTHTFGP